MAVKTNYGWPVTVITLALVGALFLSLGVRGLVGAGLALLLFHLSYRVKHGYWFDEEPE